MTTRTQQSKSNHHTPNAPLVEAVRQRTYDYMTAPHSVPSTETPAIRALMEKEFRRQQKKANGIIKGQPASWERIEEWTNSAIEDGVRWHDRDEELDRRDAAQLKQRQQQERRYQQEQSRKSHQQAATTSAPASSGGFLSNLLGILILLLAVIVIFPAVIAILSSFLGNILHPIFYKNGMSLMTAIMGSIRYGIIFGIIAFAILLIVDLVFLIRQEGVDTNVTNFVRLIPGFMPLQVVTGAFLVTFLVYAFFHVTLLFKILLIFLAYYAYVTYRRFLLHD